MLDLRQIERKGFEFVAASMLRVLPLLTWELDERRVTLPFHEDTDPNRLYRFRTRVEVPETRFRWLLKVVMSGNALLKVDGSSWAGIDDVHTYAPVEPGSHEIELVASPRSMFGFHRWSFTFSYAALVEVAWRAYATGMRILATVGFVEALPRDSDLRRALHELLSRVLLRTRVVPSLAQVAVAMSLLYEGGAGMGALGMGRRDIRPPPLPFAFLAGVYGAGVVKGAIKDIGPVTHVEELLREAERVERELSEGFEELRRRFPKIGEVYAFAHSHIDAAWLWPYSETREKILRTFSTVVRLFKEYSEPVFVQSSAQYYAWLEELDPELFEEVSKLVRRGRWIPVGGMWVESDTNLVDGESLARQLLYGQRYFLDRFGRIARIGWLPDTFGFAASLPQLLRKSGIEVFVTHKVMWNDTNPFPHHSFIWVGCDGSEIPVQVIVSSYSEPATPESVYKHWRRYANRAEVPVTVYAYGYGDGGGGPTLEMMEYLDLIDRLPGLPRLVMPREGSYIEAVKRFASSMPRWRGELYVEIHRGTYTTNLRIKELMARAEALLREAEVWSTSLEALGAGEGFQGVLDELWKRVLLQQFHDVLPGSSIKEVYDDAYRDLEKVLEEVQRLRRKGLELLVGGGNGVAVANPLPWRRTSVAEVSKDLPIPVGEGGPVECQEVGDKRYLLLSAPPTGFRVYQVSPGAPCRAGGGVSVSRSGDSVVLENEFVRVGIGRDGSITSLVLKEANRELLSKPSNVLVAHVDKPGLWDAWDVEEDFLEQGEELEVEEPPRVVVEGPLVSCVEVSKRYRSSRVVQRICLYKGSPLVEVRTRFSWVDRGVLVKAWFWPSFDFSYVTYDVPYGAIERPAQANTSWEAAKYEVPALRWADASDGEVGLAIIAPSRHGYTGLNGALALSLIKAPVFPNPWSDVGEEETVYYIYPHRGSCAEAGVPLRAAEAMHPMVVVRGGSPGRELSVVEVEPPVVLGAFKKAFDGDGYVLRLFNPFKRRVVARVRLGFEPRKVVEVDIPELNVVNELEVAGRELKVELGPLEVKTLKLLT